MFSVNQYSVYSTYSIQNIFFRWPPAINIIDVFVGIFLHVLADTLGSVGVIISAGLIQMFGKNSRVVMTMINHADW